jgi:hypothetical protein
MNIIESRFQEILLQSRPIKSEMKHARVILMKLAAIQVQIGNAQMAAGGYDLIEQSQKGPHLLYMVKGHIAHNEIVIAPQRIARVQIDKHGADVVQLLFGDLRIEYVEHPLRAVDPRD